MKKSWVPLKKPKLPNDKISDVQFLYNFISETDKNYYICAFSGSRTWHSHAFFIFWIKKKYEKHKIFFISWDRVNCILVALFFNIKRKFYNCNVLIIFKKKHGIANGTKNRSAFRQYVENLKTLRILSPYSEIRD